MLILCAEARKTSKLDVHKQTLLVHGNVPSGQLADNCSFVQRDREMVQVMEKRTNVFGANHHILPPKLADKINPEGMKIAILNDVQRRW